MFGFCAALAGKTSSKDAIIRIVLSFGFFTLWPLNPVNIFRAGTVGYLPMHSASSRTSYSREPASKRTPAKALSAARPFACLSYGASSGTPVAAIRPEAAGDLVSTRSCLPDGISSGSRLPAQRLPVSSQRLACESNSAHGSSSEGKTVKQEESWPGRSPFPDSVQKLERRTPAAD